MKYFIPLLITLLNILTLTAEVKTVEMNMVDVAYTDPFYADVSADHDYMRLQSTLVNDSLKGLIYFTFNNPGNARFELLLSNSSPGKVLNIHFNGTEKQVFIPLTNDYEWVTILNESLHGKLHYSCLVLQNITRGDILIRKLRIKADRKICDGIRFNRASSGIYTRNAPYLSLRYGSAGDRFESFYNEITIPNHCDPYFTYAAALGWQGLAAGYSGLDKNNRTNNPKKSDYALLYAVWNTAGHDDVDTEYQATLCKVGENITPARFTGEGEGLRLWNYSMDWTVEKTYCLLVNAHVRSTVSGSSGTASDTTFFSLYWKEKDSPHWTFHGIIASPYNGAYMHSLYSFLENFNAETGHLFRKVKYSNQWVKHVGGEWKELLAAYARHNQTYGQDRTDKGVYVDGNGFVLWSGGYLPTEGEFNESLPDGAAVFKYYYREPSNTPPPVTDLDELGFERDFSTAKKLN